MQNIDVRFSATSNFGKATAELNALNAAADRLNTSFQKVSYAQAPNIVDPNAWRSATGAVTAASAAFRNAAASSGLWSTQQIRATTEAEKFTKSLQKQKLTMGEMLKNRNVMREVYRDQLRYQKMSAQYWGTDTAGRAITDIAIPKNVPTDLDTMRRRMGMFGNMTASASRQVINLGKNIQWSGRQLMVGFTYPMTIFGAAAGMLAYQTEAGFAKIKKVYDFSAEAQENNAIREQEANKLRIRSMEQASRAANMYGATIKNTLEIQQQLAAAGKSGTELFNLSDEVQRISTIGDIETGQMTEAILALTSAFKTSIDSPQKLTDTLNFMNEASNATMLSLQDIAEAIPRAASGMAALNVDAKDMIVLLVAMRENGVDAAEAANALKSATTRILNPTILAKGTELFKKYGEAIDVQAIATKSEGNFMKFIELLGVAENKSKKLTVAQKNSVNAALFGTYQFNRLTAALTNVGDAYAGVENQTRKAMDISKKTSEELAAGAARSLSDVMDNSAGKFKKAWANLLYEVQKVGEPFLKVATEFVEVLLNMSKAFNGWDDKWKNFAIGASILLALVGPAIMLTGLMFNLVGQFGMGIAKIAQFIGISKLWTKEEMAAAKTTEAANIALAKQGKIASNTALEINSLTASIERAIMAFNSLYGTGGPRTIPMHRNGDTSSPVVKGQSFFGNLGPMNGVGLVNGGVMDQTLRGPKPIVYSPMESQYMAKISNQDSAGKFISQENRLLQARNKMAYDYMEANNQVAKDATKMQSASALHARNVERMSGAMSGAALSGGILSASLVATMLPLGEGASNLAKWGMILSIGVPLVKTMVTWLMTGSGALSSMAKSAWGLAAAQKAAMMANVGMMGKAKFVGTGIKSMATGLIGAVGKANLITAAVVAAGAGIMMWRNHLKKVAEEQTRIHNSVNNITKEWADGAGKVAREYRDIRGTLSGIQKDNEKRVAADEYMDEKGKPKESIKSFNSFEEDSDAQNRFAEQHFLELMSLYGKTANQAASQLQVFYEVAGLSAERAALKADNLLSKYRDINSIQVDKKLLDLQIDIFKNKEAGTKEAESSMDDIVSVFIDGFANAGPVASKALIESLRDSVDVKPLTDEIAKAMQDNYSGDAFKAVLDKYKITDAKTLSDAINSDSDQYSMLMADLYATNAPQLQSILALVDTYNATQQELINKLASSNTDFGRMFSNQADYYKSFDELIAVIEREMPGKFKTLQDSIPDMLKYKKILDTMGPLAGIGAKLFDGMDEESARLFVNLMNVTDNLAEGKTLSEAIAIRLKAAGINAGGLANSAEQAKNAIEGMNSAAMSRLADIQFSPEESVKIVRDAMSAVQSAMAESAMAAFDQRWDASMENAEARAEAAQKRIEDQRDAALAGIEKQRKAEEKINSRRQRLFEDEKRRLEKLAELKNQQIDFETAINEGKLDEAAKIQNNMQAGIASDQMDKDSESAQRTSDKRMEVLEKRERQINAIYDRRLKKAEDLAKKERKGLERTRNYERAVLSQRMEMFKAYTAKNQTALEAWMKKIGLTYSDFGANLNAQGAGWAATFKDALSQQLKIAGTQVANDKMWKSIAEKSSAKLLAGLGFPTQESFAKFILSGKLPKGYGDPETRHDGGVVGGSGSSRGSIPNTYQGLHRTEKMIRAQKGEYVINKKQAAAHKDLLDQINSGVYGGQGLMDGSGSDTFGAVYGQIAGAVGAGYLKGLESSMKGAINRRVQGRGSGALLTGVDSGYQPGKGGRHRPIMASTSGRIHDNPPAVDFAAPIGTAIYAVADGRITRSEDIRGFEPRRAAYGKAQDGFKSYGRVVHLKTNQGPEVLYAHLSKRNVATGAQVKGGAIIGRSGDTGNSTGPHLHFGSQGASPMAWLRRGGKIRFDNTAVAAHKGETMLSARLTKKFEDNVASGGGNTYAIDMRGTVVRDDSDIKNIKKAVEQVINEKESKLGRKRVVS